MGFMKKIDTRSRKAMVDFLTGHFRYYTMGSHNMSTSYAHDMKIYNLPLTYEEKDRLYELMECQEAYDPIHDLIADFDIAHRHRWQAGFNGRSGGYLVLYRTRQR